MDPIAVNRYAQALFNVACARGEEKKTAEKLFSLIKDFEETGLKSFFQSPRFSCESKQKVIDAIGKKISSEIAVNFLHLLLLKNRTDILPAVGRKYNDLYKHSKGITTCEVILAEKPTGVLSGLIQKHLERVTGGDVEMNIHIDQHILGGAEIRIGHRIIDVSFLSGLEKLTESLEHVRVM